MKHISKRTSRYLQRFCCVVLLVSGAFPAHAAELLQYTMYASPDRQSSDCALVARHVTPAADPTRFPGVRDAYGCSISLARERYEEGFAFCFLAGINLHRVQASRSQECVVQQRDEDFVFVAHIGPGSDKGGQVMCYFTCLAKSRNDQ
jgi:hypothetical protein